MPKEPEHHVIPVGITVKLKERTILMSEEIAHKTIAELEAMHTGTLMNRRKALLRCPETSALTGQDNTLPFGPIGAKDTPAWKKAYRDLKSVLDKREHLPNKQERKAMRQARAKKK